MKCTLGEHDSCFGFDLEPENASEVVMLARFGLGKTKELRYAHVFFNPDGTASATIVFGKNQNPTSMIG